MKNIFKEFRERYPTWSMPTKIGIWIGIIGLILGIVSLFLQINPFKVKSQQTNQGNWTSGRGGTNFNCPTSYVMELTLQNEWLNSQGVKLKLNRVKLILPSGQEAWIKNFTIDKTYHIANCNDDSSNCCINPGYEYKKEYDSCFIFQSDELKGELFLTKSFDKSNDCYYVINGSQEIVNGFFSYVKQFGIK